MPEFVMLIGIPASGKSSLAKKYELLDYKVHSSDAIREEMNMDIYNPDMNNRVFDTLHSRVIKDLMMGHNVVYDACNISRKKRMYFLSQLKNISCTKIAIFMATPYDECIKKNATRDNPVPEHAIKSMYENIYIPNYYEGWDKINIYSYLDFKKTKIINLFENRINGLDYISQENPHHMYTVGEHCRRTALFLLKNNNSVSPELYEAALLHDIGKPFTKTFVKQNGEIDSIAHYYQHHLVSAYMSLFVSSPHNVDLLKRANYIQWHMQPFFMESSENKYRYMNLWGKEFYDDIYKLHTADISSTGKLHFS